MPFGWDPRTTFQACLAASLALLLVAVALRVRLLRFRAAQDEKDAQLREKLVLLLGRGEKIIESGIPGVFISLDKFFRDLGFGVVSTSDLSRVLRIFRRGTPLILGIDWNLGPKARRRIDALCGSFYGLRSAIVFFYNATDPETLKAPASLPQAAFLGEDFAALHVLEIVSYAISLHDQAPRPDKAMHDGVTFEGRNIGHALPEVLQLLESGRRTGLLSVEDGVPVGVIGLDHGEITFAQTRLNEGLEAIIEILSANGGTYHFFERKRILQSNCRMRPQDALLQWTCRLDENGKAAPTSL